MFDSENPFRKHKEIADDTMDKTTKDMYNSDKITLRYIGGRKDMLHKDQHAFIDMIQEFVDGVEAGIIKHWWEYFMPRDRFVIYASKKDVGWQPFHTTKEPKRIEKK